MREVCDAAVAAAVGAGASYADARLVVRRSQSVAVRNGRVDEIVDVETEGVGVRVLVGGAWGFAADRIGRRGRCARRRAARGRLRPRGLRPRNARARPGDAADRDRGAPRRDRPARRPARRPDRASPRASTRRCEGRRWSSASRSSARAASSACSSPPRARRSSRTSSRAAAGSTSPPPTGRSAAAQLAERVRRARATRAAGRWSSASGCVEEAPRVAEQAAALLRAEPCPARTTTLVIDADQAVLQLHESVGHPTELDRVLGFEAAYAGTSFLPPRRPRLAPLRLRADERDRRPDDARRARRRSAGTTRACPAAPQPVVGTGPRRLARLARGRPTPGLDARRRLVADAARPDDEPAPRAGRGLARAAARRRRRRRLPETNRSWSIDDKRLNFQFGTQCAWEIRDGRLGRLYRDPVYTGIAPTFWGSLDAVAGPRGVAAVRA